jgi:hypothetical protein
MQRENRAPCSALRPTQASAAELVAGGKNIAIPAQQPLGEITQGPVKEYALSASSAEIDLEEAALMEWASLNRRLFPDGEIEEFEKLAGSKGGGSEHDAWKIEAPDGAVVIRRTIKDSYGFRFSSPYHLVFEHAATGIRMHDVHAGNFIRQRNGLLIPIDVFFEGIPPTPLKIDDSPP